MNNPPPHTTTTSLNNGQDQQATIVQLNSDIISNNDDTGHDSHQHPNHPNGYYPQHHPYGTSQHSAHSHHRINHAHHHNNRSTMRKVTSQVSVNNNNNTHLSPSYSVNTGVNSGVNSGNNSSDKLFHSTVSFGSLSSYYNPIIANHHHQRRLPYSQHQHHQHEHHHDDEYEHDEHEQHHVHYFASDEFDEHFYPPPSSSKLSLESNDDYSHHHDHDHHHHDMDEHELEHLHEEHPIIVGKYHPDSKRKISSTATTTTTQPSSNGGVNGGSSHAINATQSIPSSTKKSTVKQYFQSKYLGFEQHLIRRSEKHRDNEYRSQLELITAIDEHCDNVLHTYGSFRMFILSLMGGIYVSIGTLLSGLISSDLTSKAMQKFMIGIAFVGAFTMIIFSKSILFTEVNISVSVHLFKNDLIGIIRRSFYWVVKGVFSCFKNNLHIKIRRPHKSIKLMTILNSMKLWTISIFGNILGTVMMSSILAATFVWYDSQSMVQFLSALTKHKLDIFIERGASGWFSCLLSGMVANFMIGVATLLCSSGTTIIGKIIALFFPIIAFAALGVQHAPANVGYFSHIFIWDSLYGATTNLTITPEISYVMNGIEWYESIIWNLIPAAIGNALGGIFLAFIFVFIFIK